jgi:hypothetical protein
VVDRNKSKLEKLLAQPDIFDCLRRINQGIIKSYDDLDIHHQNTHFAMGNGQLSRRVISSSGGNEEEDLNKLAEI